MKGHNSSDQQPPQRQRSNAICKYTDDGTTRIVGDDDSNTQKDKTRAADLKEFLEREQARRAASDGGNPRNPGGSTTARTL